MRRFSSNGKTNHEGEGLTLQYTRSVAVVVVDLIM